VWVLFAALLYLRRTDASEQRLQPTCTTTLTLAGALSHSEILLPTAPFSTA